MREWLTKEEFDDQQERLGYPVKRKWLPQEEYDAQQARRKERKAKKPKKSKKRKGSRRMSDAKRNFKERAGWQNRHHDKAKSLAGTYARQNIIYLDERRHSALHLCFGLRTMFQISEVCLRMHDMKNGTKHSIIAVSNILDQEFDGAGLS